MNFLSNFKCYISLFCTVDYCYFWNLFKTKLYILSCCFCLVEIYKCTINKFESLNNYQTIIYSFCCKFISTWKPSINKQIAFSKIHKTEKFMPFVVFIQTKSNFELLNNLFMCKTQFTIKHIWKFDSLCSVSRIIGVLSQTFSQFNGQNFQTIFNIYRMSCRWFIWYLGSIK